MNQLCLALACAFYSITAHVYASEPSEVVSEFYRAMAKGDAARASELLSTEITIYESGYVERSRAEYSAHHLPEDIAFAKASSRNVLQHTERQNENFAFIWEETETKTKIKGKNVKIFGTETTILQKIDDQWRIVHLHWSSRKPK
ncbi:YybH family protein [Undibacterium sp. Ren11W]|uniref:YybH family protein n=1 Tax=Undibacterium sp. Ren11W TaxID=3413045 RepID=UPI003BF2FBAA